MKNKKLIGLIMVTLIIALVMTALIIKNTQANSSESNIASNDEVINEIDDTNEIQSASENITEETDIAQENIVLESDTVIVAPEELLTKLLRKGFRQNYIITIEPDEEDIVEGIKFETIPAYNTNKQFHPKENGWVGYIIEIAGNRYYIAGDTDITEENKKVKCDVAFVPVRRHIYNGF